MVFRLPECVLLYEKSEWAKTLCSIPSKGDEDGRNLLEHKDEDLMRIRVFDHTRWGNDNFRRGQTESSVSYAAV